MLAQKMRWIDALVQQGLVLFGQRAAQEDMWIEGMVVELHEDLQQRGEL